MDPRQSFYRSVRKGQVWLGARLPAPVPDVLPPGPPVHLYCVYRRANEARTWSLVSEARQQGWPVALWALDGPTDLLADSTVGSGPGLKFDLLNHLLSLDPPGPEASLLITDDDVIVARGSLAGLVRVAAAASLELAQPARSSHREASHPVTYAQPATVARLTTFVEIGPVFLISPDRRADIVPFPADAGMGWGLDVEWARRAAASGWRLGVVDCVQVDHPDLIGASYETAGELDRSSRAVMGAGVEKVEEIQHTLSAWRRWRPSAPWLDTSTRLEGRSLS